jgi:transcriptional regulator with PAS, ATPase and Fis domain
VKGAFTGASFTKKGRFKLADQGTIFLDEVGELTPSMQAKFLRIIETGTFEPVGSDHSVTINARVISATNRLLENEIHEGRFRHDLFFRICVIPIFLPPLRDRRDDISLLTEHYLRIFSKQKSNIKVKISKESISILENYYWPGNIRELQNTLKYAILKCQNGLIEPVHLPHYLFEKFDSNVIRRRRKSKLQITDVITALRESKGNKRWAAEILGVSRSTLYRFFESQKNNKSK